MAGGHGGQAVVRGPTRRGGARQQSGHLLVEVRAHGPEQEELMVGERPVLPAAEQAQRPQGLTVADNAVLEGVIDLKGLIALLVDGGAQPLLFPHQVALPEEGGLPAAAQPGGVVVGGKAHVPALGLGKGGGDAEGVHQVDGGPGLRPAHDAGVAVGNEHPQHRQKGVPQVLIGPASVQLRQYMIEDQKLVFLQQ